MKMVKINNLLALKQGIFIEMKEQMEGFCLNLGQGIGFAVFKAEHHCKDYTIYRLTEILKEEVQLPYSLIPLGFVLWNRQEAILADQAISAYRSDLGLNH